MLYIEMDRSFYSVEDHTEFQTIQKLVDQQQADAWLDACGNLSRDTEHKPVLQFASVTLNAALQQALNACSFVLKYFELSDKELDNLKDSAWLNKLNRGTKHGTR